MAKKNEMPAAKNPVRYSRELADVILKRMAEGESLRAICRDKGMPSEVSVRMWAVDDRDGFGTRYAHAMMARCDFWADEILEISDDSSGDTVTVTENGREVEKVDHEHINRSRLRVDSRRWLMSKLAPGKYGDKVELAHKVETHQGLVVNVSVVGTDPTPPAIDVQPERPALPTATVCATE
jgi:hypothetical protein